MQDLDRHAEAIVAWLADKDLAAVETGLADGAQYASLIAHIDAIADAANSDDDHLRSAGLRALFAGVVEPLNDGFTPAGRRLYEALFPHVVHRHATASMHACLASFRIDSADDLAQRYARIRRSKQPAPSQVLTIAVLSRVTIGADILLTTVALQRLRQRYPSAAITLIGDPKLEGLIGGMSGVHIMPHRYARRGSLSERLESWVELVDLIRASGAQLIVAPDSRLDQLGILPVIEEEDRYLLWENVLPENAEPRSLADELDTFLVRRLGIDDQGPGLPCLAPSTDMQAMRTVLERAFGRHGLLAIKLDHGGNPAKALPRQAEIAIISAALDAGWRILLDRGFGDEELAASDKLIAALDVPVCDIDDSDRKLGRAVGTLRPQELADNPLIRFHGSIAGWGAAVSCCSRALSYDSVGHHLAAALGIPVVVAFTGHTDDRFPIAWQPRGPATTQVVAIPTADKNDPRHWQRVTAALGQPSERP